jgi:hypothetical protein
MSEERRAEILGAFPLRSNITVLPADDPNRLRLGWVLYEEIGVTIINSEAISRADIVYQIESGLDWIFEVNDKKTIKWLTPVENDSSIPLKGFVI